MLTPFYVGLVSLALTYGLFAFGLDLLWGRAGIVSIGHAVFFGVGAYGVAIAATRQVPPLLGAVAGVALAMVVAAVIGAVGLRRGATPSTTAVLTLGVTLLAAQVATAWVPVTGGSNGLLMLSGVEPVAYLGICVATVATIVTLVAAFVLRRPMGNRLVAMRINPERARQMGIDVGRLGVATIVLSGAIAGVAGALAAPLVGLVSPEVVGIGLSTQVLIWVAIGGRNTLLGPFVGAMAVSVGQNLLSGVSVRYYLLALGVIFVVVVLIAPDGLVGQFRRHLEIRPVWTRRDPAASRRVTPHGRPRTSGTDALEVSGVVRRYGAVPALDGVDLTVGHGEIVCLIGPNGAGKTTLLNVVSGELDPDAGGVRVFDHDVTRAPIHVRFALGMARTFQVPSLYPALTVAEHLTLARQQSGGVPDIPAVYQRFTGDVADKRAWQLSLGDRRALEIALALASQPDLLLLDEPAAGLERHAAQQLASTLRAIRERVGCAILVVEHDMEIVRTLADRVVVLHQGRVIRTGLIDDVSRDDAVRSAYLGAG